MTKCTAKKYCSPAGYLVLKASALKLAFSGYTQGFVGHLFCARVINFPGRRFKAFDHISEAIQLYVSCLWS